MGPQPPVFASNSPHLDSGDQLSVKSMGNESVGCRNGEVLPNSFHPGYIRTIQFADYCNSPPGSEPQGGAGFPSQSQSQSMYIVQQNGSDTFFRRVPMQQVALVSNNSASANLMLHQGNNQATPPSHFGSATPSGYSILPQSSFPSVSPSRDSFNTAPTSEWEEIKQAVSRIFEDAAKFFNQIPIPVGENVIIIDTYSRIFFPIAFTVFNLVYWWHYIMDSE